MSSFRIEKVYNGLRKIRGKGRKEPSADLLIKLERDKARARTSEHGLKMALFRLREAKLNLMSDGLKLSEGAIKLIESRFKGVFDSSYSNAFADIEFKHRHDKFIPKESYQSAAQNFFTQHVKTELDGLLSELSEQVSRKNILAAIACEFDYIQQKESRRKEYIQLTENVKRLIENY